MNIHCMITLNGIVPPQHAVALADAIAAAKPYAMDFNPTPEAILARLSSTHEWEFPGIKLGKMPTDLETILIKADLEWAWTFGDTEDETHSFVTFATKSVSRTFIFAHYKVCLSAYDLTPETIEDAKIAQNWLNSASLTLPKTAHDYMAQKQKS